MFTWKGTCLFLVSNVHYFVQVLKLKTTQAVKREAYPEKCHTKMPIPVKRRVAQTACCNISTLYDRRHIIVVNNVMFLTMWCHKSLLHSGGTNCPVPTPFLWTAGYGYRRGGTQGPPGRPGSPGPPQIPGPTKGPTTAWLVCCLWRPAPIVVVKALLANKSQGGTTPSTRTFPAPGIIAKTRQVQ